MFEFPNFNEVYIGAYTVYQALGFATIVLCVINIICYLICAFLMWNSKHEITRALRDKILMEAKLTVTTAMMGIGAFAQAPFWYWQLAFLCRVIFLVLMPILLFRVVRACLVAGAPELYERIVAILHKSYQIIGSLKKWKK